MRKGPGKYYVKILIDINARSKRSLREKMLFRGMTPLNCELCLMNVFNLIVG
jgi:hypothetical protein